MIFIHLLPAILHDIALNALRSVAHISPNPTGSAVQFADQRTWDTVRVGIAKMNDCAKLHMRV